MESRSGRSPYAAALAGKCPRCGSGPLYSGILKLAPVCSACGLELARYDQGDGPAAFAIFFVGFVVTAGALWLELAFQAPYWVHAVIWPPVILVLTLVSVRVLKSWLVAAQFRHDAREGRLSGPGASDDQVPR